MWHWAKLPSHIAAAQHATTNLTRSKQVKNVFFQKTSILELNPEPLLCGREKFEPPPSPPQKKIYKLNINEYILQMMDGRESNIELYWKRKAPHPT